MSFGVSCKIIALSLHCSHVHVQHASQENRNARGNAMREVFQLKHGDMVLVKT